MQEKLENSIPIYYLLLAITAKPTKVRSSTEAFESSPEYLSLGFRLLDGWFDHHF